MPTGSRGPTHRNTGGTRRGAHPRCRQQPGLVARVHDAKASGAPSQTSAKTPAHCGSPDFSRPQGAAGSKRGRLAGCERLCTRDIRVGDILKRHPPARDVDTAAISRQLCDDISASRDAGKWPVSIALSSSVRMLAAVPSVRDTSSSSAGMYRYHAGSKLNAR